jgi:hypothetical protein
MEEFVTDCCNICRDNLNTIKNIRIEIERGRAIQSLNLSIDANNRLSTLHNKLYFFYRQLDFTSRRLVGDQFEEIMVAITQLRIDIKSSLPNDGVSEKLKLTTLLNQSLQSYIKVVNLIEECTQKIESKLESLRLQLKKY